MVKRMLIDATHAEETRVAVVDGNRLVEFDYESKYRKPLKGSIFLAKVTRVEPSLQAAFVNFGGNRHGFLPFAEIHPDYFRIPISDREALIAEQEELLREAEEEQRAEDEEELEQEADSAGESAEEEAGAEEDSEEDLDEIEEIGEAAPAPLDEDQDEEITEIAGDEPASEDSPEDSDDAGSQPEDRAGDEENGQDYRRDRRRGRRGGGRGRYGRGRRHAAHRSQQVEILGGTEYEDNGEASAVDRARFALRRKYKIQEVIKRGQIMLIQVSREERGNKGAAVSTYLSLPGRYGVLMPNSPRAGGVSRKIANPQDRARLRDMLKELDIPKGMSVILRTAGVARTKPEIKRDVDYLTRLWSDIRELTLNSTAPALIYEEADLMKRAIRDLYSREVEDILVAGKEGYDTAKKFMKMMVPSHVKRVQEYTDPTPLFQKFGVESQISEIGEPTARLKSGGYLVINPTEALVSIDVNSGRATKERHIEETALNTNLEAAEEVARQLRLRDLGGLIVVDFIDMEDRRNNARVERRLKEALASDRARIQIGRISSFGLLEMSRQRLNPSLTEAQFEKCPECHGTGHIRTPDATAIMLIRAIEDEGIKGRAAELIAHVASRTAVYLLNHKRDHLNDIEQRYGLKLLIRVDEELGADKFRIEVSKPVGDYDGPQNSDEDENEDEDRQPREQRRDESERQGSRDGGRRRGRRGGRGRGRGRDRDDRRNGENRGSGQFEEDSEERAEAESHSEKEETVVASESKERARGRKKADAKPAEMPEAEDKQKSAEPEAEGKDTSVSAAKSRSRRRPAGKKERTTGEADSREEQAQPVKSPAPSNDTVAPQHAKAFEVVNEEPQSKKKGWWNRLVE